MANNKKKERQAGHQEAPLGEDPASKKSCMCRLLVCSLILLLVAGGIAAIVAWRVGALDNEAYAFTGSNADSTLCNGLASNCGWRVNEIMFPTVHNAMSSRANGFLESNNNEPLEAALDAGFRALFLDSCACSVIGTALCHNVCAAGYRTIPLVFNAIMEFMKRNPNEVVIIEIQIGGNTLSSLFEQVFQIPGFSDMMYKHPGPDHEWPLMKDLIANNTRLIVFQHDGGSCKASECPLGVHDTYDHAFETPYDSIGADGLLNVTNTCKITRGDYRNAFFISNHFAGDEQRLPDINVASEVNLAEQLEIRLDSCQEIVGRRVNMLAVDFWDVGNVLEVVTKYNTALGFASVKPSTPGPSPAPSVSLSTPARVPSMRPSVKTSVSSATSAPQVSLTIKPTVADNKESEVLVPATPMPDPTLQPTAVVPTTPDNTEPDPACLLRLITMEEIEQHVDDRWVLIYNRVYDLSTYDHPGGNFFIRQAAGTDATAFFETEHEKDILYDEFDGIQYLMIGKLGIESTIVNICDTTGQ